MTFLGLAGTALARVHLRNGRLEATREAAWAARDRRCSSRARAFEGHALHVLGEVATRPRVA